MVKINNSWLVTNYSCNNRCKWCYADGQIPSSMGLELAIKSIDFLSSIKAKKVIIIGGEPTLHPSIIEIIRYCRKKELRVGMVTNGRKLSDPDFLSSLLNAGLGGLTISIEGSTPEIHDSITQRMGSYEETVLGIKNYIESGKIGTTSTTVSRENIGDLENIVVFLTGIGARRIGFTYCTHSPGSEIRSDSLINPKEASKLIEKLYLIGKCLGVEVRSITPLPLCNVGPEVRKDMLSRGVLNYSCQMYNGSGLAIGPEGEILPCVHWARYPLGNIFSESGEILSADEFYKFWEDPIKLPSKFRETLWKYPSLKCKEDQEYWGECIGGCPTFWIKFEPAKEIVGI